MFTSGARVQFIIGPIWSNPGNSGQLKATQGNSRQFKAIQGNSRQLKSTQVNPRQLKVIHGNWCIAHKSRDREYRCSKTSLFPCVLQYFLVDYSEIHSEIAESVAFKGMVSICQSPSQWVVFPDCRGEHLSIVAFWIQMRVGNPPLKKDPQGMYKAGNIACFQEF